MCQIPYNLNDLFNKGKLLLGKSYHDMYQQKVKNISLRSKKKEKNGEYHRSLSSDIIPRWSTRVRTHQLFGMNQNDVD